MSTQLLLAADVGVVTKKTPLRDESSIGANALGELKHGTRVNVLRRKGLWFEVEVIEDATLGWVRFSRVRVTRSIATQEQTKARGNLLTSLSRSATGLFGYGDRQSQSGTVATAGIRGLNASDLNGAHPDPRQVEQLDTYRSSPDAATFFARVASLIPQPVDYLEESGGFDFSLPGSSSSSTSSSTSQRED